MRFALIGQPNCGKSTLFNQVAGYKAETGNFSGTTVTFTESKVRVLGEVVNLVDLPGTYTLAGMNPAERESLAYLTTREVDVIINVIDASHLLQGLNLTMELLELNRPLVVTLNMMDEAARLGMQIDGARLAELLGVPVLPLIASKGRGIKLLFTTALETARAAAPPKRLRYSKDLEDAIHATMAGIDGQFAPLQAELVAIKLLEGTPQLVEQARSIVPGLLPNVQALQHVIEHSHGQPAAWVVNTERRNQASRIVSSVMRQGERYLSLRDRLDDILLHPVLGYVCLVVIMLLFFEGVYGFGRLVEPPVLAVLDILSQYILGFIAPGTLFAQIVTGLIQGITGGIAIVLPYLLPFLVGMGVLEDIGYLPRIAFLMDALMHKLGLHGKAVVPFILGYGCNVPAVMSTRILEEKRDRYLAAALATLVPCAARLAVVFGLVAFYLGPVLALAIYLFNLFVIAVTGKLLSRALPEDSPGLIMEIPVYRLPTLRTVLQKARYRVNEFVVEAWPVLIGGSIVLSLLVYFKLSSYFDLLARPVTWTLGLPQSVGVPLIFGILRKELSLVMLGQALGSTNFARVLSPEQMITFSVFVVFYIPCLATLSVLRRELGTRAMFSIAGLTVVIALIAAFAARVLAILAAPFIGV
ncbi:MAG: ferrous iron transport protein B [Chloroflexi bacterium]|nr:ferrous iron transport protein B [Chloroflexota bacterium]MCL5273572.1 ferrous iron transport protein B [Chloroflexota bacterium]